MEQGTITLAKTHEIETRPVSQSERLQPAMAHIAMVECVTPEELEWQDGASCNQADPEAFFPEKGVSSEYAKKVCGRCDVRSRCLEYALANDERHGIWGGLSESERRKLRKPAA
ncbi:Transcriptional regulator WhiB [compost metagenome]